MEKKGNRLYEKAMNHATDDAVKAFFKDLANDELEHMNILEQQFKAYIKDNKFSSLGYRFDDKEVKAPDILDDTLKDKINAASFEATVITASINFEEKAITMYAQRAKEATDPEEKKMYNWLSVWEKTHLEKLMSLEASLMEDIWHDNNFWPF